MEHNTPTVVEAQWKSGGGHVGTDQGKLRTPNLCFDDIQKSPHSAMSFCPSVGSPFSPTGTPFEIASPFYRHNDKINNAGAGTLPAETTNTFLVKISDRVYFEFLYVLYSFIGAVIAFLETSVVWICCVWVDNNFSAEANCFGNGTLFLLYFGFCIWFELVESPPPLVYKIGCWLYTIGYGCFAIPSLLTLLGESDTFGFEMYLSGSVLFTAGSVLLLFGLESIKTFDLTTMFVVRHTAWWGAVQFLIGSICFVIYSFGIEFPYGNSPWLFETTGQWLSFWGTTVFVVGRIHFLVDASIAIKSSWENLLETEYIKRDHDVPLAPKIKIKDGPPPKAIHKRMSTIFRADDARISYLHRGSAVIQNDMNVIKFTSRRHSQLYTTNRELTPSPVLSPVDFPPFIDTDIVISGNVNFNLHTPGTPMSPRDIIDEESDSLDENTSLLSKPVAKYS